MAANRTRSPGEQFVWGWIRRHTWLALAGGIGLLLNWVGLDLWTLSAISLGFGLMGIIGWGIALWSARRDAQRDGWS